MCSLCGDLSGRPDWTQVASRGAEAQLGRHRARCVAHAAQLAHTAGLRLSAWQRRYLVSDRRGRTLVVDDLPACWVAAERLLGEPLDPLTPEALASLGARARR